MKKQLLLILMTMPITAMAYSSRDAEMISVIFSLITFVVSVFVLVFFFKLCVDVNAIRKYLDFKLNSAIREGVKRALNEIKKEEENRESNTN